LVDCPRCGSGNRDGAVLCSNCGTALPPSTHRTVGGGQSEHWPTQTSRAEAAVAKGAALTKDQIQSEEPRMPASAGQRTAPKPSVAGRAQPYRREMPSQYYSSPPSGWGPQAPAEWVPEPTDLGPLIVGPTTIGLILLAAALLLAGAATPLVVATALDDVGSVTTILRYSPPDSAAFAASAVLVLLGRRRGWTIFRLLVVLTALVGFLLWRYFTFGSIPIDAGGLSLQHVRLGPGYYLGALGTLFVGAGFFSAVRGHF
jgi:hypothetical protein